MRNNSLNLEDETVPLLSSLEESIMSPAISSAVVQDNTSMEGFPVEKTNHACFGMTVILEDDCEHLTDEKIHNPNLHVTLPSETELGCRRKFLCDSSNSDHDGMPPPSGETSAKAGRPSHMNRTFVEINNATFMAPTLEEQDSGDNNQTSTPVLNIGNRFSPLPLSGSPLSVSKDGPEVFPPQGRQIPQTPEQQMIARLSSASGKAVKTFPKPDYSVVKSRIMTQLATPGTVPAQHKTSKINGHAKPSRVNGKALGKLKRTTASVSLKTAADPSQPGPLSIREDVEGVSRASLRNSLTGIDDALSALNTEQSPRSEQTASGQEVTSTQTQQPAKSTFCSSSSLLPPEKNDHADHHKPSPKKAEESHGNGVGSGSTSCCDIPPLAKMRSFDCSTSQSRPPREKKRTSSSSSFNFSSTTRPKPGNLSTSVPNKQGDKAGVKRGPPEGSSREVKKISLVAELPKSKVADASGSTCDQSKGRLGARPSPRQSTGLPASRLTAASPATRPVPLSSRLRHQGTSGAVLGATDLLQVKQNNPAAHPRALASDKATMGAPTTRTKPAVNGFRLQTSNRPSTAGSSNATASKTPHQKAQGPSRSTALKAGLQSDKSRDTGITPVAPLRPSSFKTLVLKTRLLAKPPGETGPPSATSCKSASSGKLGSARSTVSPLRRTVSLRIAQSLPGECLFVLGSFCIDFGFLWPVFAPSISVCGAFQQHKHCDA